MNQDQARVHRASNLAIAPAPTQGTTARATLLDRMRDAVGSYTAHVPLEDTETGREALDVLADLQIGYAAAIKGHSSRLAEMGFRDAVQVRKQMCGAAQPTLADLSVLHVALPEAFVVVVHAMARIAGGTFQRYARPGRTMSSAVADLQRSWGEFTARFVEASEDGHISDDERRDLAGCLRQVRAIEASLDRLLATKADH